jgi:hypothetical protein
VWWWRGGVVVVWWCGGGVVLCRVVLCCGVLWHCIVVVCCGVVPLWCCTVVVLYCCGAVPLWCCSVVPWCCGVEKRQIHTLLVILHHSAKAYKLSILHLVLLQYNSLRDCHDQPQHLNSKLTILPFYLLCLG